MQQAYALHEGAFGRAIAFELRTSLVAHAHSETQLAFWLGGARAQAHIGSQTVDYSEHTALGVNAFELHDAVVLGSSGPCIFLAFMISKPWLDERSRITGRSFKFSSPQVPIAPALRQSCWRVLDMIMAAHEARAAVDDEVERLLAAAVDASMLPHPPEGTRRAPPTALDYRLRGAIAHMRRVGEGESMTTVAIELGFSAPGNFSRFFKEHTGVSPSTYRRASTEPSMAPVTGMPR